MIRHWIIASVGITFLAIFFVIKEVANEWISSVIDTKILIPVILTLTSATLVSVLVHMAQIQRANRQGRFRAVNIAEAVKSLEKVGKITKLDIYAISSRHLHAQLVTTGISATHTRVLLWEPKYYHTQNIVNKFGTEIAQVIASGWKSSNSRSCFPKVDIKRYVDLPDIFYLVANNNVGFVGFYERNGEDDSIVNFNTVILLDELDGASQKVIIALSAHFMANWTQIDVTHSIG